MLCPFCKKRHLSETLDPQRTGLPSDVGGYAAVTGKKFTTFEVQFQELTVIKGNGNREPIGTKYQNLSE